MSSSSRHDAAFPAVERYLRETIGCRAVLREPMPPRNWSGPWASPDLFGIVDYRRTFAVDVKVSYEDACAQLDKIYVREPRHGVGLYRVIAAPTMKLPLADGYGLWTIRGEEVSETSEPYPARARNWRQEACMAWAAGGMLKGPKAQPSGRPDARGEMIAEALAAGPLKIGALKNLLKRHGDTRTVADLERAMIRDPRFKVEDAGGVRMVSMAGGGA